ncbi:MAG TPA: hypothetical protein VJ464_13770 [Blastocatellia bacterium]|nr:hypothetical protein [Blastocatellia bacterium]
MEKNQRILRLVLFMTMVFLLLSIQEGMAQKSSRQEDAPSLKETLDWLKEKLNAYASFTETIANRDAVQKVDLVSFDECTLTYKYIHKSASVGLEIQQRFTFSLGDIDPSKSNIDGKEGHFTLVLHALDSKPKIKVEMNATFAGPLKQESKWIADARFPFDSLEMADRVSKAFAHAINLCKSRKELFPSTLPSPSISSQSQEKPDSQSPAIKIEAVPMPITVFSVSLHDTAHPKFQSTDWGWCFLKLRNDDPARTISGLEVEVMVIDSMRQVTVDHLHLNLEGKVKARQVGEMSVSLGTYFLPQKWSARYRVGRIIFEDGSEWKRP